MSEMETNKPSRHWFHIPIQLTVAACCIYWYLHVPAPNKAVLLLGGVAAIMGFVEMRPMHKAIYFVLIIWLMFIETHAIDKDRLDFAQAEHEKRKEETQQFSGIRDDLKAAIKQGSEHFDATMAHSDTIMAGVSDNMRTQTGGDSFGYITFTPEPANVRFNQFPTTSGPYFLVSITSHGRFPLRGLHVWMMDPERQLQAMQHTETDAVQSAHAGDTYYEVPYLRPQSPEAPTGDVQILGTYPFGTTDANDLTIAFSGPNGFWDERLHLRRVNGTWLQALTVIGPTVKQMKPFVKFDEGYPDSKGLAERDWPRPTPKH